MTSMFQPDGWQVDAIARIIDTGDLKLDRASARELLTTRITNAHKALAASLPDDVVRAEAESRDGVDVEGVELRLVAEVAKRTAIARHVEKLAEAYEAARDEETPHTAEWRIYYDVCRDLRGVLLGRESL